MYVYNSTYFLSKIFNHGNNKKLVLTPEKNHQTESATMEPLPCHIYHNIQY